jgi:hypothetical protein
LLKSFENRNKKTTFWVVFLFHAARARDTKKELLRAFAELPKEDFG